eukprot:COSAG06_NODE_5354_length_3530_cov_4.602448_3_plen_121_part_00
MRFAWSCAALSAMSWSRTISSLMMEKSVSTSAMLVECSSCATEADACHGDRPPLRRSTYGAGASESTVGLVCCWLRCGQSRCRWPALPQKWHVRAAAGLFRWAAMWSKRPFSGIAPTPDP